MSYLCKKTGGETSNILKRSETSTLHYMSADGKCPSLAENNTGWVVGDFPTY